MTRRAATVICLLAFLAFLAHLSRSQKVVQKEEEIVVVHLPDVGHIKGRTLKTLGRTGGEEPKTYYNFRNIPFAQSVSGEFRFSVLQ